MGMTMTVGKGADDAMAALRAMGDAAVPIAKMAVYDGAGAIADAVRAAAPRRTGDLAASTGITGIKVYGDTVSNRVGFSGYDRYGRPNLLKARVREMQRPFFRKAVASAKAGAEAAMRARVEGEIAKAAKRNGLG